MIKQGRAFALPSKNARYPMNNKFKTWRSIEDQIKLLKNRGMIIDNEESARIFLRRVGYYRLSGYWYKFRKSCNGNIEDNFKYGTKFSQIIEIYNFDRKLRILSLDAIERIELSIQVDIAYLLGKRSPVAHLNPCFFDKKFVKDQSPFGFKAWLSTYHNLVRRSKAEFVKHNLEKYGELPIWVAIEVMDFGCLSILFKGLKQKDKLEISKKYRIENGETITSWLRALNFIRNISAHHSRLWNRNVTERMSLKSIRYVDGLESINNNSRPFIYFCLMKNMLDIICPESDWGKRFIDLCDSFPSVKNEAITLKDMGIEEGWQEWSLWS